VDEEVMCGNGNQIPICWANSVALGEFTVTIPEPHATLQGVRIHSDTLV